MYDKVHVYCFCKPNKVKSSVCLWAHTCVWVIVQLSLPTQLSFVIQTAALSTYQWIITHLHKQTMRVCAFSKYKYYVTANVRLLVLLPLVFMQTYLWNCNASMYLCVGCRFNVRNFQTEKLHCILIAFVKSIELPNAPGYFPLSVKCESVRMQQSRWFLIDTKCILHMHLF